MAVLIAKPSTILLGFEAAHRRLDEIRLTRGQRVDPLEEEGCLRRIRTLEQLLVYGHE